MRRKIACLVWYREKSRRTREIPCLEKIESYDTNEPRLSYLKLGVSLN